MNTQWLIVMSIVVVFALAGVMGALYINSIHVLSNGTVTIIESAPPMGVANGPGILAVTTRGDGTVVIDPYKTSYAQGEEIRLQAIPLEGHEFVGWEGAIESDKDIVTVTMSGSKLEVEAIFD